MNTEGILLQGLVTSWTHDIILEYQSNFPNAKILLSTWTDQNVDDIPCDVVKTKAPEFTKPHSSTINHQIIGTREGLKKLNCDIILKSKSDMFIHNENIFQLYFDTCDHEKIMIPNEGFDISDQPYYINDNCQVAKKNILNDFWNKMPLYDGSFPTSNEQYLTKNYIVNIRNDDDDWSITQKKYFCQKRFDEDFQCEFEKFVIGRDHQKARRNLRNLGKELSYEKYIEMID
jgi:hypothetical protein|tara:strand:- start:176 stop:868 length:693 start_codon:yes stop_codon:yes gene_type:complete